MGSWPRFLCLALALAAVAAAADPGKALLTAARAGDADAAAFLLRSGSASILETQDKNGKTALMLAAESGHVEVVRLLLEKGAKAGARDREGLTAWGLALLSSSGRRAEVLAALPKPPLIRINVDAAWLPDNMVSSCFLGREQLAKTLDAIHPDALVLGGFADLARVEGRESVDILRADSEGLKPDAASMTVSPSGADATVALEVRPGVSCLAGADNLSLQIDVRVNRAGSSAPAYQKTFGGGLKGLHAQPVTNPGQYPLFFKKWAETHAEPIYLGVLRTLLRQ